MSVGRLAAAQWKQIGPAPVTWTSAAGGWTYAAGGRVYDIAIDPSGTSDQIIYLATGGGIWKSLDGGTTWAPKTDRLPWNQMGAVAIDPANPFIIYAGGIFGPATGPSLFRSIDAGETWSGIGGPAMSGQNVVRIVIPSAGVVLVATFNGLFRSVNGGASFGSNKTPPPGYNNNAAILTGGRAWDLHLDTATPTKVYACIGGTGLFVSIDSGATWTNLFAPAGSGAPMAGSYDVVIMAQSAQPDSNTLYASISSPDSSSYVGLYKSTNGGSNWVKQTPGPSSGVLAGGQFDFNHTIGVDPQDAKSLYLGFVELSHSTDGGSSFAPSATALTQNKVHSDHHGIAFSPKTHWGMPATQPTRVYVATDGGLATSGSAGMSWTNLNDGVATILVGLGALDIGRRSAANNRYSYAGSRDNGTAVRTTAPPGTDWQVIMDGDGSQVAVDPSDPKKAYCTGNGAYVHTLTAGASWFNSSSLPPATVSVGPLAVDPQASANVYAASGTPGNLPTQLMRSIDTGSSFSPIGSFSPGILCIAVDPSSSNTVWVGLADGSIWRTDNALATRPAWTSSPAGLPARGVNSIAVDPSNSQRVVAGYGGLSSILPPKRTQHVYLTTDKGTTWGDVSGTDAGPPVTNLPDLAVWSVVIDPGSSNSMLGVASSDSMIVAVGQSGAVLASVDGINWTKQAPGAFDTYVEVIWMVPGPQFLAVGSGGSIITSPNGIDWTVADPGLGESFTAVASSGVTVVAATKSTNVYTSTDGGTTWTKRTAGHLNDVIWAGPQFVGVGNGGMVATSSPDGATWTSHGPVTADDLMAVAWSGRLSLFAAVGANGTILTSPDGVNWTQRVSPTSNLISDLTEWTGRFVGVVSTGGILTSTDGVNWTLEASPASHPLKAVTFLSIGGPLEFGFVAAGDLGSIVTTPDGVNWTDRSVGREPFELLAANDTAVLGSVDSGATWRVFGVGLPTAQCMSLALDWRRDPSLLRVGTNGRSVFELATTPGPRVVVLSNLAFGPIKVGSTSPPLKAQVFNVGSSPLAITSFMFQSGTKAFLMTGAPTTLQPGDELDFTLQFQPTMTGNATAVFALSSNDPVMPTVAVPMSGIGI